MILSSSRSIRFVFWHKGPLTFGASTENPGPLLGYVAERGSLKKGLMDLRELIGHHEKNRHRSGPNPSENGPKRLLVRTHQHV